LKEQSYAGGLAEFAPGHGHHCRRGLKQAPGDGLLWVGGSGLASQFLELGLIDEIRIILTPWAVDTRCLATSRHATG